MTPLQGWLIVCEYPERLLSPLSFLATSTSPETLAPVRLAGLSPFAPLALPGEQDAEVHDSL